MTKDYLWDYEQSQEYKEKIEIARRGVNFEEFNKNYNEN